MKALSDPNRVKILKMLQHRMMCVCEIKEALGLAQPTISRHLKVLESAGLVGYKKDGLWVNYHITGGDDSPYAANLLGNLARRFARDNFFCSIIFINSILAIYIAITFQEVSNAP